MWELIQISEGAVAVFKCLAEDDTNLIPRKEQKASISFCNILSHVNIYQLVTKWQLYSGL